MFLNSHLINDKCHSPLLKAISMSVTENLGVGSIAFVLPFFFHLNSVRSLNLLFSLNIVIFSLSSILFIIYEDIYMIPGHDVTFKNPFCSLKITD